MKSQLALSVVAWFVVGAVAIPADATWQFRGTFERLEPGDSPAGPGVAVFRLERGREFAVPVDAFPESVQESLARQVRGGLPGVPAKEDRVDESPPRAGRSSLSRGVDDVEGDAVTCRTAAQAVDLYRLFLAVPERTPEEVAAAKPRLEHWRQLASEGKVRFGREWVSADVVDHASREANSLVDQAVELVRIGNAKLAQETFDKAGRIGKESLRVRFLRALMPLLRKPADFDAAVDEFSSLVRDYPGNGFLLCDLATCEVMARRPAPALVNFWRALQELSDGRVVVDNVGLVVANANNPRIPALKMTDRMEGEFAELYRFLTQDLGLTAAASKKDLAILGINGQSTLLAQMTAASIFGLVGTTDVPRIPRAEGLGVVVAPGKLLADRGLVMSGDTVAVRVSGTSETLLPAAVVAHLEEAGLSLISCEPLATPAIPVAVAPAAAGEPVTVVGRDLAAMLAKRPMAAAGSIVAAAGAEDRTCIYRAQVPHGPAGTAVVDARGRLVGVTAPTPRQEAAGSGYGLAFPVDRLRPFLEQHGAGLSPAADAPALEADEVARKAVESTVVVVVRSGTTQPAGR